MNGKKISVIFEFTETGYLKSVFLNADNEQAQTTLEKSIDRLFKQNHCAWIKRLFKIGV
jgi:hypothetical protein